MIRVGILGAGFMGKTHGEAYKQLENVEMVGVANRSQDKGLDYAKEFDCDYYSQPEELIKRGDVDVIDICLPTFLHEKYAVNAALHGKHILLEKPFTLTLESAERVLDAVDKSGVKMMLGQTLRFWPEYTNIKQVYEQGKLGRVDIVYANRLAQLPDWNDWFRDEEKSGGGLFDLHLHDIDYVCYLFGEVKSVYAAGKNMKGRGWNHVISCLHFTNGTKAWVEAGYEMTDNYPFTMTFRGIGNKGTIDFNFRAGFNLEERDSALNNLVLYQNNKEPEIIECNGRDAYLNELEYFIQCIENNEPVEVVTPRESREVLKVVLAIKQSLESGQVVKLQ